MSDSECKPAISPMLIAADVAKSVAYYTDVLGFTLRECWPNEEAPMWASLELNGQTVMLGCPARADDPMCQGAEGEFMVACSDDFKQAAGGGVLLYLCVEDVDAYHKAVSERGGKPVGEPRNQFYGLRDFQAQDLVGYRFSFFQPIQMESCQSCGMPLTDAKTGQMYCDYCTDENGRLKSYDEVFEGCVSGFFMGMQKMERPAAEAAATEMLAKMPAWACREGAK